jgi:hypothetical protein
MSDAQLRRTVWLAIIAALAAFWTAVLWWLL